MLYRIRFLLLLAFLITVLAPSAATQECPDCKDPHVTFVQYRLGQVLGWLSGFASRKPKIVPTVECFRISQTRLLKR